MKRIAYAAIGMVALAFIAWFYYNFILGAQGRQVVDNIYELPFTAVSLTDIRPKPKAKPICSQMVVPAGDCNRSTYGIYRPIRGQPEC